MTATKTPNAFLCTVGNLGMYRSNDASAYVLRDREGIEVGTYPTAKAANEAGIALITASLKSR